MFVNYKIEFYYRRVTGKTVYEFENNVKIAQLMTLTLKQCIISFLDTRGLVVCTFSSHCYAILQQ